MSRLSHVTIGYPQTEMVDVLRESSLRAGFDFICLPRRWSKPHLHVIDKFKILLSQINSGEFGLYDIILFTDAYDVLIVGDSRELLRRFFETGYDIIFNAEKNFYPIGDDRKIVHERFLEEATTPWAYLNSGCYIGYAWAIMDMLEFSLALETKDDQAAAQDFYLAHRGHGIGKGQPRVGLDRNCDLFGSLLWSEHHYVVDRGSIVNRSTKSRPMVLHANGDRSNMPILAAFQRCYGDPNATPLDLRVARFDEDFLSYDPSTRRLTAATAFGDLSIIFVLLGGRVGFSYTPLLGICTYCEDGSVNCGAEKINSWELIDFSGLSLATKNLGDISSYSNISELKIFLEPAPLSAFKDASFFGTDQALAYAERLPTLLNNLAFCSIPHNKPFAAHVR